jgi:hypothetical protein
MTHAAQRLGRTWRLATASALLAACSGPERTDAATETPTARQDVRSAEAPVCLSADAFAASGRIDVRSAGTGDARRVAGLRWERHDGCERFVIDLAGEDGSLAARPGTVSAEVLRDLGVVRVTLPDVGMVDADATDAEFNGSLAGAAYAFLSPEGRWVQIDLHMSAAAEAAVLTLEDPARVVVDLRPGGPPIPEPAPRTGRVVVLQPRPGPASYPLTVTGYARTFEANVVVRLEHDGQDVHEDFTTATAWLDAWGHYTFTVPEGPAGRVVLHVGEHSARDGTWEGVAVRLRMR